MSFIYYMLIMDQKLTWADYTKGTVGIFYKQQPIPSL